MLHSFWIRGAAIRGCKSAFWLAGPAGKRVRGPKGLPHFFVGLLTPIPGLTYFLSGVFACRAMILPLI